MKRNLPVRADEGSKFGILVRIVLQYIILRVIQKYSERLVAKGAWVITQIIFSAQRRRKQKKYGFAGSWFA